MRRDEVVRRWRAQGVLSMGIAAVSFLAAAGCNKDFSDCAATRSCSSESNDDAGAAADGDGAANDVNDGGADAAGASVGNPCTTSGELACAGSAQKILLVCNGASWGVAQTCSRTENCDNAAPSCATIVPECDGFEPGYRTCVDNTLVTCGPDLVSAEREECAGTCANGQCQAGMCGDGRVETDAGESCDDGNDVDTDDCPTTCQSAACGDGFVYESHEACDDGNDVDTDDCLNDCQLPTCGDDAVWEGHEQCEAKLSADCRSACKWIWDPVGEMCALQRTTGLTKCWGFGYGGQYSYGDIEVRGDDPGEMGSNLPTVDLGAGHTAKRLASNETHACAILDDGALKCWGGNSGGELGLENWNDVGDEPGELGDALPSVNLGTGRTAVSIATGYAHTCAILDNATVKCWGDNVAGELGLGNFDAKGDDPGEMGDALPIVSLGTVLPAKPLELALGAVNSCVLFDTYRVKCWGDNSSGQVGIESAEVGIGDEVGEMGNSLPFVNLGTGKTVQSLDVGYGHVCALLHGGAVKCWGANSHGELGLGDMSDRGDNVGEMGDALPAVDLGTGVSAVAVSVGAHHSCALLDTGAIKCWGANDSGQLGVGLPVIALGDTAGEMGDALPAVDLGGQKAIAVDARAYSTCAVLEDGSVRCWGQGRYLGLGDTVDRGRAASDMGNNLPAVELD